GVEQKKRRARRGRGRAGLEPWLAVSAERRPGVPGPVAELQGRAREGVEPGDHGRDQERRQPLVWRGVPLLSEQEPRRQRVLRQEARRSEADLQQVPAGDLDW